MAREYISTSALVGVVEFRNETDTEPWPTKTSVKIENFDELIMTPSKDIEAKNRSIKLGATSSLWPSRHKTDVESKLLAPDSNCL